MPLPLSLSSTPLYHAFQLHTSTNLPICNSLFPFPLRRQSLIVRRRGRGRGTGRISCSLTGADEEWIKKLPDRKKPLYAHSLPCIEAWLRQLGFFQSRDDRALWIAEKHDWHARLSLDVTDLHIRYLKNGPGNLEKDVERRFSYALSREDIENAILGGP